jgi:acyl dehydratase
VSTAGQPAQDPGATVFASPDDLLDAVGRELGTTAWATVDPEDVARFAEATLTREPPGRVPPLMLLSLTNRFLPDLLQVPGASNGVNYGTGSVRFPAEVKPGDRLRVSARISDAVEVSGGVQTTVEITVELDGSTQPACVVESLSRWMR